MAGLLSNTKPAGTPNMGTADTAGAPVMMGAEEEGIVSPEEQKQYDEFVGNGMTMAYDEQMMPQIIQSLQGDGNPAEGLGNTVAMIVMRLEDSAKESGVEISGDVMYHGAVELVEQLAELGEEAGVLENTDELRESALYTALDVYRTTRQDQGTLPVDAISEDMNELVAADKAGTVDQMLPGISQYAQRQQGRPQET